MKLNQRWIRVEDRLPAYNEKVLACFRQNEKAFINTSYLKEDNEWDKDNITGANLDPSPLVPTHWMPLFTS